MPLIDMPLPELERYTGRNPRPADHDAYWQAALDELASTDPKPELVRAEFQTSAAECLHLYFNGVRGARIHAKYLRTRMRQQAQEAARKLTVKLVFPVFFLIFPSVLLVTLGPAILQMQEQLFNMIQAHP